MSEPISAILGPKSLQAIVDRLAPWHYCHVLPYGVTTGDCTIEQPHPKLVHLLECGAFKRKVYPKVLDLGANSGLISMWFAQHRGSLVTAVEGGSRYFEQLQFVVDVKGYADRIAPVFADIVEWNAAPKAYDLVLLLGVLHHIQPSKWSKLFANCFDVLTPSGEIVVQTESSILVETLLQDSGFVAIEQLHTNWSDRAAWWARKDAMTI